MSPDILIQRAEALRPLIEQGIRDGLHRNALQLHVGVSHATLDKYRKLLGLPMPRRKQRSFRQTERVRRMISMRQAGSTLQEIAEAHGVSRERVRQILAKYCPDHVPGRVKTQVVCDHCDRLFTPEGHCHAGCCSHDCLIALRQNDRGWNRDRAELIMELRGKGMAWGDVATECDTGQQATAFRSTLQRYITILFSSAEQERYFPGKRAARFRTPDGALTSNRSASTAA